MDRALVVLLSFVWLGYEIVAQVAGQRRLTSAGGAGANPDEGRGADRGSLILLYVAISVGFSVAFTLSFVPFGRLPAGQPVWLIVGGAIAVAGLAVRISAKRSLARQFTYQVQILPGHELVERGLYRRIRHPAYLGQLVILAGAGIALGSWLSIVALLTLAGAAFAWRMHVEEAALRSRFPVEYPAYCARTRRLIPRLH